MYLHLFISYFVYEGYGHVMLKSEQQLNFQINQKAKGNSTSNRWFYTFVGEEGCLFSINTICNAKVKLYEPTSWFSLAFTL